MMSFFGTKVTTVADALAPLTTVADNLAQVQADSLEVANDARFRAGKLQEQAEDADHESIRAGNILNKLNELLGG